MSTPENDIPSASASSGTKISSCFKGITSLAQKVFRQPNGPEQPEQAVVNSDDIVESMDDPNEPQPRFMYDPDSFPKRLVVGIGGKTKLASSTMISLPYRSWIRWLLVGLLALVTVFLTPQLLPNWLGFEWSTPSDLCTNRDQKLERLRETMESIANITEGKVFVERAESALKCMNLSSEISWSKTRKTVDFFGTATSTFSNEVQYPTECIASNAKPIENKVTECIPRQCARVCLSGFKLVCKRKCTPEKCQTFSVTDPESERKIAELNAQRKFLDQEATGVEVAGDTQEVAETADKKAEQIISRLLIQIDIASNLYIFYTMLAIIVGTPVVIYKRGKSSRVIGATFGLRKSTFIVIVIVILTIYDSGVKVFRDTDFPRLLRNFQNDPCYLDPAFSQARLQLIKDTCGNVTEHRSKLESTYAEMTRVFYDASLCEVSSVQNRGPKENNKLVATIDRERNRFSDGKLAGYVYPASCNATELSNSTADAPESGVSFAQAFLGSGILAQILLKAVLSSWLLHLIAYIEPLTMHRGIVEVFGIPEGTEPELTRKEAASVNRFARDKHLLPLILTSLLMIWEVVIIVYSIILSFQSSGNILEEVKAPPITTCSVTNKCVDGFLQRVERCVDRAQR